MVGSSLRSFTAPNIPTNETWGIRATAGIAAKRGNPVATMPRKPEVERKFAGKKIRSDRLSGRTESLETA